MGKIGEAKNPTHQLKKLDTEAVREFRDRFRIPIPDDKLEELPFYRPDENAPEMKYLHDRRRALGGYLPQRRRRADETLKAPPLETFSALLEPTSEGREISTTQAFVRFLTQLVRDKALGPRVVPIIPDEARTFGMEGMFRQLGIFSQQGQLYEPVDRDQVMYYREDKAGQILEEGINEAGAMSSWMAGATSYSSNNRIMVPFYIFYSMFGFQRVGDLSWAAGDMQARGFLLGGTSGRTTLNGEGLQHQDGHSHILASTIPNGVFYDPTFAYEVAVILRDGLRRMVDEQENVWYYVTLLNENYPHPGLARGQEAGILKGMYRLREGPAGSGQGRSIARVQLLGCGSILREALAAAELLEKDWGGAGDVWSVTSFTELRRDGLDVERWNLLHPASRPRKAYATEALERTAGPIIATSDYMRLFADQIRPLIPQGRAYKVLGTDGFGRSDTREKLRQFFEVDRYYVTVAALKALAEEGAVAIGQVAEAESVPDGRRRAGAEGEARRQRVAGQADPGAGAEQRGRRLRQGCGGRGARAFVRRHGAAGCGPRVGPRGSAFGPRGARRQSAGCGARRIAAFDRVRGRDGDASRCGAARPRDVPARARLALGAAFRARRGRRPEPGQGFGVEGPDPAGGRARLREDGARIGRSPRCRAGCRRHRAESAAVAASRFRPVRPDRAGRAVAPSQAGWTEPASQLAVDSARDESRGCGRHRAGGVPGPAEQGKRTFGRETDDAGVPDQGMRGGAEEVSRIQLLDRSRRRRGDREAVLSYRLRRRHAQRPRGAGGARGRPQGPARSGR